MTWPLCTFLPPTHNNKHCSTQGGGRWQKIWVYQRPNCFKEGPVHKKLAWISSQILFFKLEKGCGFLTLFFCLAHFSYLVSDITVLQTRFSPLPIGVHRNKQYPHNRWAPRTWRGGALECLTGTVQRELRWVKIGINRTVRINCIAGKCHLCTLPQGTPSQEKHKRTWRL
jgi:hypothetical protein